MEGVSQRRRSKAQGVLVTPDSYALQSALSTESLKDMVISLLEYPFRYSQVVGIT